MDNALARTISFLLLDKAKLRKFAAKIKLAFSAATRTAFGLEKEHQETLKVVPTVMSL